MNKYYSWSMTRLKLSVERVGFTVGTEWWTSTWHRTLPRKNGGERAEEILLIPQAAWCGFWQAGTEGGNWKLILRPGGSNITGQQRIGSRTQIAGPPQAGGRARKTGLSENTGLRWSTKTTSVWNQSGGGRIYPSSWGRGKDREGAREGINASSLTNTYLADSKAAGSIQGENGEHDEAEELRIQLQLAQSCWGK